MRLWRVQCEERSRGEGPLVCPLQSSSGFHVITVGESLVS
jgi:hypothetical protein